MDAPFRERSRLAAFGEPLAFFGIQLDIVLPVGRNVRINKDCVHRALRLAQSTVDAFVWVDEDLIVGFINTIHWTNGHTRLVLHSYARLGNDVGHLSYFSTEPSSELSFWHTARKAV